jgi:predicted amidohydrolase
MEEKRKNLKIMAVQISSVAGDKFANFKKVKKLIAENIDSDVDLVVLPEVWTCGWACDKFIASADLINDSETIRFLSEIAKNYNVNIAGGSFISKKEDGKYYNTCPFINRQGELIATYDKMHLYSYYGCDEGKYVTCGENPVIINIDDVKIGLSICYDIRFPELYRVYRKAGVDLFLNCAAWSVTKPVPWEVLTKARAVENQTYMVALTQSGALPDGDYNIGHSRIIDYKGETLAELGVGDSIETSQEGVMKAVIDFEEMQDFREKCTVLNDIHQEGYKIKEF